MMQASQIAFYILGVFAVLCGIGCISQRNPIAAAMWLVGTMLSLAAMYVILNAQFIGVIQVLVYAGAIMVVFLFVIMLLNLGRAEGTTDARGLGWKVTAGAVALAILAQIFALTKSKTPINLTLPQGFAAKQIDATGVIAPIAGPLFNEYLLAFEVTSILLLAAVVGAVVLGKQRGEGSANAR